MVRNFAVIAREGSGPTRRVTGTRARVGSVTFVRYSLGMKKRGMLEQIKRAQIDGWLRAYGRHPGGDPPLGELLDPGRAQVRAMHDDELATIMSREPSSKLGRLAASELRSRESWRGPAKWSLIISGLAFALSIIAFFRTI